MGLVSRASVLDGVQGSFRIEEAAVPETAPGSMIVKQELCGICGTDVHIYQGHLKVMVDMPVVLGHEFVGRVADLGSGVTTDSTGRPLKEGDRIAVGPGVVFARDYFTDVAGQPTLAMQSLGYGGFGTFPDLPRHVAGGFATYQWLVPETRVYKMETTAEAASLLEPLSIGVHAASRAKYAIGDTVVIQGAGPIGLMALIAAKELGAFTTIVIGAPAERLDFAKELGADITIDITKIRDGEERAEIVRQASGHGQGADIVIEATGVLQAIPEGMGLLRRGGQYVTCGHFTNVGDVTINPWAHLTFKQISLYGVWSSAPEHFVRARQLLERGTYPFEKFVSHVIPLERLGDGIQAMSGAYELDGMPVRKIVVQAEG
jgi:threonine dehydrogenase-like Zn-dependent dehydrogenase